MKKLVSITVLSSFITVAAFGGIFGFGKKKSKEVELNIPHYKAGQNVGAKLFLPMVERFNTEFEGKYQINIEEVPQDQYPSKIKLLQQQNKMPALIEGPEKDFVENVIVKNDLSYDLSKFLEERPSLKNQLIEESLDFNTKNGKIVGMPLSVLRPIGIYYNKDILKKAGITKDIANMSFDEFDEALAKIKNAGYAPLALMTSENAWTSGLLFSTILANEPGGAEILKSYEIKYDYTSKPWINAFARLQKYLMEYTTGNAIGAAYADAANNFLNERAAIIANGPWMIGDFYDTTKTMEDFDKKVGATVYPGGTVLANTDGYFWWVPKGLKKEETEAALAFLEFMNRPEELEEAIVLEGGTAPNAELSDNFSKKLNPILSDLNGSVVNNGAITVPPIYSVFPSQIQNVEFGKLMPKLADGSMTPTEFAESLTKKAQQFK